MSTHSINDAIKQNIINPNQMDNFSPFIDLNNPNNYIELDTQNNHTKFISQHGKTYILYANEWIEESSFYYNDSCDQ